MAEGFVWAFEQIDGPKRRIELRNWNAPMGRPRQGAVVRPAVEIRETTTRYPGGDGLNVTRHIFGPDFPDIELKGRFRRGQVQNLLQEMTSFVADAQPIRATWGNFVAFEGFIKKFDPGIEGANENGATEVEWTLLIRIDSYPNLRKRKPLGKPKKPTDFTDAIKSYFLGAQLDLSGVSYTGDILDAITDAIDVVTGAVNDLAAITDNLDDWKKSTLAELNRVRGACANVIRSGQALREFVESIPVDAARIGARFNELEAMTQAPSVQYQLGQMLKEARDTDEQAERAIVGRTKTTHVAKDGDTWESMSTTHYGKPGRASDIRDANLAGPGENVQPGREYLIPE